MKTTLHIRLARFAGLLLLSSLVILTGVQAAQATVVAGTGAGSSTASFTQAANLQGLTAAAAARHGHGTIVAAVTPPAGAQGRGGFDQLQFTPKSGVQTASSGTSSTTTAWIAGSAAVVLLIGLAAWALVRRRRQAGKFPSQAYCAQHPEDSLCAATAA